ncbi:hypothetical protein BGZ79_003869 [Entomortierella chlamydospora]|nr:hypothetical protein BGZ79_003869 [Entomortierella chlamydospora]
MRSPLPSAAQAYAESIHSETSSRHHPNTRLTILPLPSLAALYPMDESHLTSSASSSPSSSAALSPTLSSTRSSTSESPYTGTQSPYRSPLQHQHHRSQPSYQSYDRHYQKVPASASPSTPSQFPEASPDSNNLKTELHTTSRSNKHEYLGTNMESLLDAVEVHSTLFASELSSGSSSGSLSPSPSSLSLSPAPNSPPSTTLADHHYADTTATVPVVTVNPTDSHTKRTRAISTSPSIRRMSISNLLDDHEPQPLREGSNPEPSLEDNQRNRLKSMFPRPCSPSLVPSHVTHKRKWSRLSTHTTEEPRSPKIRRAVPAPIDSSFNMSTVVEGLMDTTPMIIDSSNNKIQSSTGRSSSSTNKATIISCYHASIAQKSYGSEKRFLCPPPIVRIDGQLDESNSGLTSKPQVAMSVICESGDNTLGQRSTLEDDQSSTFRYLYVSGTAKAKSFQLKLQVYGQVCLPNGFVSHDPSQPSESSLPHPDWDLPEPIAVFDSQPIAIISKPSKKTAKARNVSSCILAGSLVSLFNRINSQTVRTKYMSVQDGDLCAKSSTWSAFTISIVSNGPCSPAPARSGSSKSHHRQLVQQSASPITYGAEIILTETTTGLQSDRLVVCKVENGRILQGAIGPICQMQKVALQSMERSKNGVPMYLGAVGDDHQTGRFMDHSASSSTALRYEASTMTESSKPGSDDFLCWTIVGISKFEYAVDLH